MDARNMVVLIGRLVAQPELRFTNGGTPVANFSVAVNRPVRKPDGTFEDELDGFFDCEFFGPAAETLVETCAKGTLVQITGSLQQKKFKTGNGAGARTVSRIEVRARNVAPVLGGPRTETRTEVPLTAPQQVPAQPQPA